MDPISTTALSTAISSLLKPATDAAGTRLLAALKALVQRMPGAKGEAATDLKVFESGKTVDAPALAAALVSAAGEDSAFEEALRTWLGEANTVVSGTVSNVNTGSVQGPLVQGRDFSGPMNF
jgi:hypothetical protein